MGFGCTSCSALDLIHFLRNPTAVCRRDVGISTEFLEPSLSSCTAVVSCILDGAGYSLEPFSANRLDDVYRSTSNDQGIACALPIAAMPATAGTT